MPADEGVRVPRTLCIPKWPSNLAKSPSEITQAMEVVFSLRKDHQTLDLIIEVNLRICGLSPDADLQLATKVGPSKVVV